MLTFQQVTAALHHEQPWQEMYELVLSDLRAGRTIEEVTEQLDTLYPQINELDLSENGRDAYGDTYDRLIGMCLPEQSFRAILTVDASRKTSPQAANGQPATTTKPSTALPTA